jgi:hypothetical protein
MSLYAIEPLAILIVCIKSPGPRNNHEPSSSKASAGAVVALLAVVPPEVTLPVAPPLASPPVALGTVLLEVKGLFPPLPKVPPVFRVEEVPEDSFEQFRRTNAKLRRSIRADWIRIEIS